MTNSWNFATGDQIDNSRKVFGGVIIPCERGDVFYKDPGFSGAISWLAALKIYQGGPVPKILDHDGHSYLIERVSKADRASVQIRDLVQQDFDNMATRLQALAVTTAHNILPTRYNVEDFLTSDQYFQSVRDKLEEEAVPLNLQAAFKKAVQLHDELAHKDPNNHIPLHYHVHHDNAVITQSLGLLLTNPMGVIGHPAREAASWLYNPHDVSVNDGYDGDYKNPRFVDAPFVTGRLAKQAMITAQSTAWDEEDILKYTFIRAVENCARRLNGTPEGQLDVSYWRRFIGVAADAAGINLR